MIEPGESFQEALHREVREESGVEIEITGFVGICKNLERNIVNIDFTPNIYLVNCVQAKKVRRLCGLHQIKQWK